MKKAERLIYSVTELALILAESPALTAEDAETVRIMAALMLHCYGMPDGRMDFTVPCYPDQIAPELVERICRACYELGGG